MDVLGLRERQFTFLDGLENESEFHCNDPGGEAWMGRKAEQFPLTVRKVDGIRVHMWLHRRA